jgi:transposase
MRKTFKDRLYANKRQQRLLDHQLEERRWLDNSLLAARRDAREQRQESLRVYDQQATLPIRKAARPPWGSVQAQGLQNVAGRSDRAFQAFFAVCRRVRTGETPG